MSCFGLGYADVQATLEGLHGLGSISWGSSKGKIQGETGFVFNGNLDGDVETIGRTSHLFLPFTELEALGIHSGYVQWLAAVVSDSIGLVSDAVEHIVRARAIDPIFPRAIASEKIILARIAALIDIAGPDDAQALAIVSTLRRLNPSGHVAIASIEDKLAQKITAATETATRRAQA